MSAIGETMTNCVRFSTIMFAAFLLRVYPSLPAPAANIGSQRVAIRADTVTFRKLGKDSLLRPLHCHCLAGCADLFKGSWPMIGLQLKRVIGTAAIHATESVLLFPCMNCGRSVQISLFPISLGLFTLIVLLICTPSPLARIRVFPISMPRFLNVHVL